MKVCNSLPPVSYNNPQSDIFQKPRDNKLIDRIKAAVFANPMKSFFIGSVVIGTAALGAYYYSSLTGSNPAKPVPPTPNPRTPPTPTSSPTPLPPTQTPDMSAFCQIPSVFPDELADLFVSQSDNNDLSMLNCNVECSKRDLDKVYKMLSTNVSEELSSKFKGIFVRNCLQTNHDQAESMVRTYIKDLRKIGNLETAGQFVRDHLTHPAIQTSITKVVEVLEEAKSISLRPLARDIRKACGQVPQTDVTMYGCHNLI